MNRYIRRDRCFNKLTEPHDIADELHIEKRRYYGYDD